MARRRKGEYVPLSVYCMDDDAILTVDPLAELLFTRCMQIAGRMPTDGYLTEPQILHLASRRLGGDAKVRRLLRQLVDAGPVEEVDGGYRLRAWLDWNSSAEDLGRERARDRDRKAALTDAVRRAVYERDGGACRYCSAVADLALDHVMPLYLGGTHDPSNLQTLCAQCNTRKGRRDATGMTPDEARAAFNIGYGTTTAPPTDPPPSPDSGNGSRAVPVNQLPESRAVPVSRSPATRARHAGDGTTRHGTTRPDVVTPVGSVTTHAPAREATAPEHSIAGELAARYAAGVPLTDQARALRTIADAVGQGIDPALIRTGLDRLVAEQRSCTPDQLRIAILGAPGNWQPSTAKPSTTDQRVQAGLDLAAELRAERLALDAAPHLHAVPGGAA